MMLFLRKVERHPGRYGNINHGGLLHGVEISVSGNIAYKAAKIKNKGQKKAHSSLQTR